MKEQDKKQVVEEFLSEKIRDSLGLATTLLSQKSGEYGLICYYELDNSRTASVSTINSSLPHFLLNVFKPIRETCLEAGISEDEFKDLALETISFLAEDGSESDSDDSGDNDRDDAVEVLRELNDSLQQIARKIKDESKPEADE